MKLDKIITLANKQVKIQFLAMERSLRATGCSLPIWVIPFNDEKFELPDNAFWWEDEALLMWTKEHNIFEMCRKYQCFLTNNYQYVDSDIIFIRNPEKVLAPHQGFISSCTHWNNPDHTYNAESRSYFKSKSTIWQQGVFNAGQFACDRQLYSVEKLKKVCLGKYRKTLMDQINIYKDQVAINLLVHLTGISVTNLTLPPFNMQSTWAGDYAQEGFEKKYWLEAAKIPYIIHWAGVPKYKKIAINTYFYKYLTETEKREWGTFIKAERKRRQEWSIQNLKTRLHQIKNVLKSA